MTKRAYNKIAAGLNDAIAYAEQDMAMPQISETPMRDELNTVKRQLIETQQTIIKLVDAIKKQQEQINAILKWANEATEENAPVSSIIRPS